MLEERVVFGLYLIMHRDYLSLILCSFQVFPCYPHFQAVLLSYYSEKFYHT